MNKTELAPGIMVFDDVFINSFEYVKEIESQVGIWKTATLLSTDHKGSSINNFQIRNTDIIPLPHHQKIDSGILIDFSKTFYNEIQQSLNTYLEYYNAAIENFQPPQLLRYGVGQSFSNHIDDHPFLTRRISMTYYLNDDYSGGDIEFDRFGITFKAKKNQLLIFPSNFVYSHTVHPITDGLRYVVVQWTA
jgi:hypothetical protein